MLTLNKLIPQGQNLAPALLKRAATIELDWKRRQTGRFEATDSFERQLSVVLPRGTVVRGGDVLVGEDGSLIRVLAAAQAVLLITACSTHGTPLDLTRAAYHLGHCNVPIELHPDHLKIEPSQVLTGMLRTLHLTVREATEAFEPEPVAAAAPKARPAIIPIAAAPVPHVHGPGCGHHHDHQA
jgi:urease accessory protein